MNQIYINIYVNKIEFYIFYYEKNRKTKIKQSEIILPISFNMGDKLYYIQKLISTTIDKYNIETYNLEIDNDMGVEIVDAVKIEGILEELFSSKGVILWR